MPFSIDPLGAIIGVIAIVIAIISIRIASRSGDSGPEEKSENDTSPPPEDTPDTTPSPESSLSKPEQKPSPSSPHPGPRPMHYFLDIRTDAQANTNPGHIFAFAGGEGGGGMQRLDGLSLGAGARAPMGGKDDTLGEWVRRWMTSEGGAASLNGREQLKIGRYLYAETIARLAQGEQRKLRAASQVILHIASPDEYILHLPWALLTREQDTLCNCGWSVLLSREPFAEPDDGGQYRLQHGLSDCELPPEPRLLVIAPQPQGVDSTEADAHLEALQEMLQGGDAKLRWGEHLRKVAGWEEFARVLPGFAPHLVYYYGHGAGTAGQGGLLFEDAEGRALDVPVADFAARIDSLEDGRLEDRPRLVYVNCCRGNAAAGLGIGRAVRAPAVLTNPPVAEITPAQAMVQGTAIWESLILRGEAPHRALQHAYLATASLQPSHAGARPMAPLLYGAYLGWRANPARSAGDYVEDKDWHLKVDRVGQFGTVALLTREMLKNGKPRCLFFIWYGRQGEGIDLFHERLEKDLDAHLPEKTELFTVRPAWPEQLENPELAFREVMAEAFGVSDLAEIPDRIRQETKGESGRRTLTYINHLPVTVNWRSKEMRRNTINPDTLGDYFRWCDENYPELLEKGQQLLIGISFLVKDPPGFQEWIEQALGDVEPRHGVITPLDEMERLAEKDLRDFIKRHNIPVPAGDRDKVVKAILKRSRGHYELTITELTNWLARGLAVEKEE
uniref:Caspase family p20 domain-containing protein n=1 Tax=Candidatus Kentrum sp. FM TaxID=2126340 RepID=A0A450SB38_9GAMM|nr:MAG: hypothetical protein BECKFM1743A_GA0114220_100654 [Candidatus Kentron sp. FM]VFJ49350.1 MAG: hypothetical protein BECKFM1743C_GA0114222_100704 [Candidatus Kentron sp. FM]VFK08262.1 MAG: hypothetical protein BECKFM1743B_GA0114221_100644 [Candidatus Kentron sp. FM]